MERWNPTLLEVLLSCPGVFASFSNSYPPRKGTKHIENIKQQMVYSNISFKAAKCEYSEHWSSRGIDIFWLQVDSN